MNNLEHNPTQPLIIFLHIPKAAGTTLRYIIQYQYKPSAIYELYGESNTHLQRVNELKSLPESRQNQIKIINAHLGFGLHEFLKQPCTYITFLRDPIERVISMYYYLRRTRSKTFQNLTLKDFILNYGGARDNMTKYLSGEKLKLQLNNTYNELDYQCTNEILDLAKKNLKEHFKIVGTSENFDEGLILLKRILGWKIPLYDKNNVSKKRLLKQDISQDDLKSIEKFNQFDIHLYEYGKQIFTELVNQQDSSFKQEVANFQQANKLSKDKIYFRLNTLYNRLIHRTYKELVKH